MAQQIRDLMTPNPVVLPGTASVHEAARAMRDADIGDVMAVTRRAQASPQICGPSAARAATLRPSLLRTDVRVPTRAAGRRNERRPAAFRREPSHVGIHGGRWTDDTVRLRQAILTDGSVPDMDVSNYKPL